MIKFSLKCAEDHRFDSWFQSAAAFDKLAHAGMITCVECGNTEIVKDVMAPNVQSARRDDIGAPDISAQHPIARMRARIEANSEYVGKDFASKARQMHDGTIPDRPIYGEAHVDEARKLVEEGVPILPLPFRPARKMN